MSQIEVLPKPPFRFIFVARSQQGKTTLLIKLLFNCWIKKFNKIFIFCPTYKTDKKWGVIDKYIKSGQVKVYTTFDIKKVKRIHMECVKIVENNPDYHSLIIFDDCTGRPDYKVDNDKGYLNILSCSGNHANISQIHCIQKLTQISRTMRLQTEGLITFHIQNQTELKALHCEFGMGQLKSFQKLLNHCTAKPFHFLYVKSQGPGGSEYYHKFDKINVEKYFKINE
jgi:hypothetical protein